VTSKEAKRIRKRLGMTQVELAEKLGIHSMTVSKWERGVEPVQKQTALVLELLVKTAKPRKKKPS
jgi:DNA-binding transcriptional regulator YiaG